MNPTVPITPVPLAPDMTIACAAAHRESLVDALCTTDGDLHLDLSAVSDFDSSGVQLLLATRHMLRERGAALCVSAASPAVHDALVLFGLDDLLRPAAASALEGQP